MREWICTGVPNIHIGAQFEFCDVTYLFALCVPQDVCQILPYGCVTDAYGCIRMHSNAHECIAGACIANLDVSHVMHILYIYVYIHISIYFCIDMNSIA